MVGEQRVPAAAHRRLPRDHRSGGAAMACLGPAAPALRQAADPDAATAQAKITGAIGMYRIHHLLCRIPDVLFGGAQRHWHAEPQGQSLAAAHSVVWMAWGSWHTCSTLQCNAFVAGFSALA